LAWRAWPAGKTSLLNTLSGKAPYGIQTGDILVNGRPDRLERYKRVMGFVPQVGCLVRLA
jgi:ABC-type multidrug transport system ATPase subunit